MGLTHQEHGFTLIEMIMSLTILAIIGASVGKALTGGALAYSANAEELQILGKLRYASERIVRETREIRRSPTIPGNFDITTMSDTTLAFTRSDGMAVTLNSIPPLLTINYAEQSGTHTLSNQVNSAKFSYYQSDTTSLATRASDIAIVEFELVLSQNGNIYPQRTRVALRNQR